MKRKVLFVITKANWGGAQRYVFDLATSLPHKEFDVAVAFGQPGLLEKKLQEANIKTFPIRSLQRNVSLGADIKSFFELRNLFKTERPDIVHLNSSKAGGVGTLAARMARIPNIVFTAHGWPFWEDRNIFSKGIIWFLSWMTALLCHQVICISTYDLRVARMMPFVGKKAVLIYNGINAMQFGSGEVIRQRFPAGTTITGTIGELTRNKNQKALIDQAKNTPHMYVAIVGEGEERSTLEQLIRHYGLEDRVKLFGFIPANEVLRGFDEFALPSIKEGLPYVLLEAKQAGLPIVANPIGGIPDILGSKDPQEFSLARMLDNTIALYRN